MHTRSQSRNHFSQQEASPVIVEPLRIELSFLENQFQEDPPVDPPEVPMADNRTMVELLQAPTEDYEDAIVIPEIAANNFELNHGLINLVQNKQFFEHDKEDPHAHIRYFNKITSTMRERFDESFYEAWDRFNDLLRACPHHGFSELHQLDTFYNALNINDQDSLNSAAGRNFLDKMPRECLKIIESKSKVCQSRAKAVVAKGAARIWLEKEASRSILTWDDLVTKFINQFFPPSKTTNLRNEITRFQQRFDESFYEAWDRFNDLLRACSHHGFFELYQLDTFYNALNVNDQDSFNSAAGGNFLDKMPRECLKIIESKSKVHQSRAKAVVGKVRILQESQEKSQNQRNQTRERKEYTRAGCGYCKNHKKEPKPDKKEHENEKSTQEPGRGTQSTAKIMSLGTNQDWKAMIRRWEERLKI
uniref:Reverse transcriptase domain-containing protein n=1 Tax=Tanacetum cinerariifolium TaxID=118510 RepID=A0A6L2NU97_TANCI|nr:reverse transcriptase domain-containing protein [Tanacetum cinerariifolium]